MPSNSRNKTEVFCPLFMPAKCSTPLLIKSVEFLGWISIDNIDKGTQSQPPLQGSLALGHLCTYWTHSHLLGLNLNATTSEKPFLIPQARLGLPQFHSLLAPVFLHSTHWLELLTSTLVCVTLVLLLCSCLSWTVNSTKAGVTSASAEIVLPKV